MAKNPSLDDQLLASDLTNQTEQFLNIFLQSVATYSMRFVQLKQTKIDDAYHEWRQFLLYERAFRKLIYDDRVSGDLIAYFDVQMPKAQIDVNKDLAEKYNNVWREFFGGFTDDCSFKQRKIIAKALRDSQYELEQDYGYEPGLTK